MIVILQIPYWIFDKEIGPYVDQIFDYSKGTLAQQSLHNDDLKLLTELTNIYRNAIPQFRWSFCTFLFCNLLCFGGTSVPLYFLVTFFDFHVDFLKKGDSYNMTKVRQKIEEKLPSRGECTILVMDSGYTLRQKTFSCNINYNFIYEFATIAILFFYLLGIMVMALDSVALLIKCIFPQLRRYHLMNSNIPILSLF